MPMVYVQGGTFIMGCTEEQFFFCDSVNETMQEKCVDGCFDWELPIHKVVISNFYISRFEVTQRQWMSVMDDENPSHFKGDSLPVESVSWDDVKVFIAKLNEKTGMKYRLPTEAEWEFAARGGLQSAANIFSGSNDIDSVAWYKANSNFSTHSVGSKSLNELGIYDMSGNVWEWCSDIFREYSTDSIETQNTKEKYNVLRGGSWDSGKITQRVSFRYDDIPIASGFGIVVGLAASAE
jgi:formylglycine-generating enzyme required for sulfatase activity